jgi:type 1 fimbriae regulatory protein FimB
LEHLSKPQLKALLAAAREHSERDWLMILVAFSHGLRASEVVGIKTHDVKDGHLTVKRLKGSNRTTQALVSDTDPLLSERQPMIDWALKTPPNQRLFRVSRITFWRAVQRHAKTAGIPAHLAHPHILKHSIAMQTIDEAGIENVRQYLGHKSISSTGAYLKVDDGQASAAVARALKP